MHFTSNFTVPLVTDLTGLGLFLPERARSLEKRPGGRELDGLEPGWLLDLVH